MSPEFSAIVETGAGSIHFLHAGESLIITTALLRFYELPNAMIELHLIIAVGTELLLNRPPLRDSKPSLCFRRLVKAILIFFTLILVLVLLTLILVLVLLTLILVLLNNSIPRRRRALSEDRKER